MKRREIIKHWLMKEYNWPSDTDLESVLNIYCNFERETEHILTFYQETGIVIAPKGDFPSPDSIRAAHPNITNIAIISLYDSLLKFDRKRPQ